MQSSMKFCKERMKDTGREGKKKEERKKKIATKVAQHIFIFYLHKKDKPEDYSNSRHPGFHFGYAWISQI